MSSTLVEDDLAMAVIDALTSQICVVDQAGVIFAVNRAWMQFTTENSAGQVPPPIGVNYLSVCAHSTGPASEEAPEFLNGLRAVLGGDREFFQIEYPCHSPKERRWFLARVTPLRRRSHSMGSHNIGAVISHMNITDRKLVEMDYAKLAGTDPLTSLPNRRVFDELVKLEMDRYLRFGEPFSLLMIDLDHFKRINDTFGHAAGDDVLRCVATLGKQVFRNSDLFARWGGEEFVCLLPGADGWGAILAAEKFRLAIQQKKVVSGERLISVTASIGVSSINRTDKALEAIVFRADKALYRAKESGRNSVRS